MAENWSAVAKAIDERANELGLRQRELAERSHVSQAIVRELQSVIGREARAQMLDAAGSTICAREGSGCRLNERR